MNFEILDFPWSHGYSKNFVDDQFAKQMSDDFPEWDSPVWEQSGKVFDTEYGYKKMLTDQSVMLPSISEFIDQLKTKEFISKLSKATGIADLIFDDKLYGGGLMMHPTDTVSYTHLRAHET